jgi:hypothetical protein
VADVKEQGSLDKDIADYQTKVNEAQAKVKGLDDTQKQELVLRADRDGVIGQGPRTDDIGKYFEAPREQSQQTPLFTIIQRGRLRICVPVETMDYNQLRENLGKVARRLKRSGQDGPARLSATVRVRGLGSSTWPGYLSRMEESEAHSIPQPLTSKANGPIAVKQQPGRGGALIPQTQHFFAYIDIDDPDQAISPGVLAQVKVHLEPETCFSWLWRKVNSMFNLRLI